MTGIIADIFYCFDFCDEEEHLGYYSTGAIGYLVEMEYAPSHPCPYPIITKIGKDNQGENIRGIFSDSGLNIEYLESTTEYTALSIEGDYRLRHSALSDIRSSEILSFIDKYNLDTVFIAASLLSFKPVSGEIVSALLERRNQIELVAVDTVADSAIMLLETLKEAVETLRESGMKVIIIGEAISLPGVGRMSMQKRNELLSGLSE